MPCLYAAIPYFSKYAGVASAGILTGMLITHSNLITPILLASPNHSIILRQFHRLQDSNKTITRLSLSSSILFLTGSYIRATKSWPITIRCWIAGFLAISVIPYNWLVMRRTERKLERLYEEEVQGGVTSLKEGEVVVKGEVRRLVDWWGLLNLGRVFGAAASFLVGIEAVRRR
ncbi:hypothetical protein TWF730_001810 [Orbilia blumenaviensis]|uniref:DUF1772-domain-containing protein n=1 Tax=Orbilia blumenaviensis TaxID=1796055 RepID=A0AAV9UGI6_9PEZI